MGSTCCSTANIDPLEASTSLEVNDRFSEILDYSEKISEMGDWTLQVEDDNLKVLSMDGSAFDTDLPVLWVQLTLPKIVSLDRIE